MTKFERYIQDWYVVKVDNADQKTLDEMALDMGIVDECNGKDIATLLLERNEACEIWRNLFTKQTVGSYPKGGEFLTDMFTQELYDILAGNSFDKDFLEIMGDKASAYNNPKEFFDELAEHGCVSGMIGELVTNPSCKNVFIKHIEDFSDWFADCEKVSFYGDIIRRENISIPLYTFIVWESFQELASEVSDTFFEDED